MRLLRENGYFFIGGTVATAILIAVVVELLSGTDNRLAIDH